MLVCGLGNSFSIFHDCHSAVPSNSPTPEAPFLSGRANHVAQLTFDFMFVAEHEVLVNESDPLFSAHTKFLRIGLESFRGLRTSARS